MKTIVITGSQGFIGSYISQELLEHGYKVIGIDNYSKYGRVVRPQDKHPNFKLIEFDLTREFPVILEHVDYVIAGAAMIGGISYFHKYAYDLLPCNEKIISNTYDWCIRKKISKVIVLSSSMVYERATKFPSREEDTEFIPPPISSYGMQKLMVEYYAKAAWDQYKIPYIIIRPFNCVGVGEDMALGEKKIISGNIELMMSHVLPDLVNKILKDQFPLKILGDGNQSRCFTNGKDIARGIREAMESEYVNETFNISTSKATAIIELVSMIWNKLCPGKELKVEHEIPYKYDVQFRLPSTEKAKKLLNWEAKITLDESIDEVINWMRSNEKI